MAEVKTKKTKKAAPVRKTRTTKSKKDPVEDMAEKKPEKSAVEKEAAETLETKEFQKMPKYFEAVGRRKSAVARVRLFTAGDKDFLVNGKNILDYFQSQELKQIAESSLSKMKCLEKFKATALVRGGGIHAQAEAVRHGTARALIKFNQDFRKRLRRVGYVTRDPRTRERKKFGLKRARRAPQWGKR